MIFFLSYQDCIVKPRFHQAVQVSSIWYGVLGNVKLITVCLSTGKRTGTRWEGWPATWVTWHHRNATQYIPWIKSTKKPSQQTKEIMEGILHFHCFLSVYGCLSCKTERLCLRKGCTPQGEPPKCCRKVLIQSNNQQTALGLAPIYYTDSSGWYPKQRVIKLAQYGLLSDGNKKCVRTKPKWLLLVKTRLYCQWSTGIISGPCRLILWGSSTLCPCIVHITAPGRAGCVGGRLRMIKPTVGGSQ